MTRGKGPYYYDCPRCGQTVEAWQAWAYRHRRPCLACTRIENGWMCKTCGSSDPHHTSPCPITEGEGNG